MIVNHLRNRIEFLFRNGMCNIVLDESVKQHGDLSETELLELICPDMVREGIVAVTEDFETITIVEKKSMSKIESQRKTRFKTDKPIPVRTISSKQAISQSTKKSGCPRKHCRLGNIECESYWGCRDTCRKVGNRITSMQRCPNEAH